MKVALVSYGGTCLDDFAEALDRVARASLTSEDLMEAFAALERELAETSPRSSVSRPRLWEYKHRAPRLKRDTGDRGAPGELPGPLPSLSMLAGLLECKKAGALATPQPHP